MVILHLEVGECLTDDVLVSEEQQFGALFEDVRDHEQDHVVFFVFLQLFHDLEEFRSAVKEGGSVRGGDLADGDPVIRKMEFLEICLQQGFCGFIGAASGGEDFGAQFIQIDSRDAREALGDPSVPGGSPSGI